MIYIHELIDRRCDIIGRFTNHTLAMKAADELEGTEWMIRRVAVAECDKDIEDDHTADIDAMEAAVAQGKGEHND